MEVLSIRRAAELFGDGEALVFQGQRYSFSDIFSMVRRLESREGDVRGPLVVKADNSVDTIVDLLYSIESRRPFIPIHPALKESEVQRIKEQLVQGNGSQVGLGENTFGVVFTSGTTGLPKGAVLCRDAMVASALASENHLGWEDGDKWILALPLAHIGGISIVTRCLLAGKSVSLLEKFTSDGVFDAIARDGATMVSVVPTMLKSLLQDERSGLLQRLRVVLVGGAGIPSGMLEECRSRGINALATYGMTETCSQVATQKLGAGAIGLRPLPGIKVTVVDHERQKVPAGRQGRILVFGPVLMDGYLQHEPLGTDGFLSADLGHMDSDGNLHVTGRMDDTIITGGENVHPSEIEEVARRFEGVEDAVAFGVEDQKWGHAIWVALAGRSVQEIDFWAFCKKELASHKVPKRLVLLDKFDCLANGKIDRGRIIGKAMAKAGVL